MTNPFNTPAASNFGLFLARATLGIYFAASGYRDVMGGVSTFAKANLKLMPHWVTPQYAEVFLTLYPVIQVAAGVMLALGVLTRFSAFLLAFTFLIFMLCCKGFHFPESNPITVEIISLTVAVAILTNGGGTMTLPAFLGKKGGGGAPKAPAPAPAPK